MQKTVSSSVSGFPSGRWGLPVGPAGERALGFKVLDVFQSHVSNNKTPHVLKGQEAWRTNLAMMHR
jgi:hypothetical protein